MTEQKPDLDAAADAAATGILGLIEAKKAYVPHRLALGPSPTPELSQAIDELGELPLMWVRCGAGCGRRLAQWRLDPESCLVQPVDRSTKAFEGKATPFMEKANAGKGTITAGNAHDGRGTHNYICRACRVDVSMTAQSRLRRYVEALSNPRYEVWIS
jgi:hypothetical protein